MTIDLDGSSPAQRGASTGAPRARWAAVLVLGLGTACGDRSGGDAAPVSTAAPTLNIGGVGQSPAGGLGAVPGGLAGPQGQPGSGGPGMMPPASPAGGNPGSAQPGSTFPGGGSPPTTGGPSGPGAPQKGGYSSGR